MKIIVIIPAHNEALSIAKVVCEIPASVYKILVVNNNSHDNTKEEAEKAGAIVCSEAQKGYGYACLRGMQYIERHDPDTDIVVFLDGDYSDYPEELTKLIQPIIEEEADFVVGARVASLRENGAMTPQQILGNQWATFLMRLLFRSKFTDLGPFRAIRYSRLLEMKMQDKTYGWTIEMQLKALKMKMKYVEIPVRYKRRIGFSKVSGTLYGTLGAGIKIMGWIAKYAFV
jgi:glycosyltransferase involved in cell wall biosynthesis